MLEALLQALSWEEISWFVSLKNSPSDDNRDKLLSIFKAGLYIIHIKGFRGYVKEIVTQIKY